MVMENLWYSSNFLILADHGSCSIMEKDIRLLLTLISINRIHPIRGLDELLTSNQASQPIGLAGVSN